MKNAVGISRSLLVLVVAIGCGRLEPTASESADVNADAAAELKPLLPFATGNTWTYRVTDSDGTVSTKQNSIEDERTVGGTGVNRDETAFFCVTTKSDGLDKTESWQKVSGEAVVRLRELSYSKSTGELELDEDWEPSKLHVDGAAENTRMGASFLQIYTENKTQADGATATSEQRDLWTVLGDDEEVSVPAGTFVGAIHLQKSGGSTVKEYWYVRGVGKVKETGSQTEELVEYSLAD